MIKNLIKSFSLKNLIHKTNYVLEMNCPTLSKNNGFYIETRILVITIITIIKKRFMKKLISICTESIKNMN